MRAQLVTTGWLIVLFGSWTASPAAGPEVSAERPNIILFIADDMAWNDSGPYGHPHIQTPGLDRLAKEGMRFDAAFLTCSSCSPSRSSIITGRYPHNTGGAHQLHNPLPGSQVTFVEKLKEAGYYTAAAGKWHLGNPTISKFDVVHQKINHWVRTLQERPKDQPFFGWFAFVDPHRPYQEKTIPRPHTGDDAVVPPFLPDNSITRNDLAMYYDEITRLDGVVNDVLDELERQKIRENTLVVFISDNGRPFPRCKTTIYDSGVKTPWIVSWPARVKSGSVCKQLVCSIDLAPTFLELAGAEVGQSFQGKSFLSLLENPDQPIREHVFMEHNWHDFEDHQRGVRTIRFKYIRNAYPDLPQTPPADAVRSPTYQEMIRLLDAGELPPEQRGCFLTPRPKEELYDLAADPDELNNLSNDPKHAKTLNELKEVLDLWTEETDDLMPEKRRPDEFDRTSGERLRRN